MKKRFTLLVAVLTVVVILLSGCVGGVPKSVTVVSEDTTTGNEITTTYKINTTTDLGPTAAPTSTVAPAPAPASTPGVFTPDWTGLSTACPSTDEVLETHGLTGKVIVVASRQVSWEPCLTVVELKPEFRGTTILLLNGYQYTAAPVDADVTTYWGGDPNMTQVTLQWGTSFRWMPSYLASENGVWVKDTCELVTREYRFGRYRRNVDSGQPDVPYYGRIGPYMTLPGNIECPGWVPPTLDEIVPRNYLQATAMLGGRALQSEWMHSTDLLNWSWKNADKGTAAAKTAKFYWQTVYVPQAGNGYVELWLDKDVKASKGTIATSAGPYKFYASDLAILLDGFHNVDEFSYHADPTK